MSVLAPIYPFMVEWNFAASETRDPDPERVVCGSLFWSARRPGAANVSMAGWTGMRMFPPSFSLFLRKAPRLLSSLEPWPPQQGFFNVQPLHRRGCAPCEIGAVPGGPFPWSVERYLNRHCDFLRPTAAFASSLQKS